MICFAPGQGGAYVFLALPATASRQLLVPAALALALESVRSPTRGGVLSTAAAGLVARRRPSDLRDLPLDPVRRLPRGAAAVDARRPAHRRLGARGARRSRRTVHALAAADRERHPLGLARCPGASAGLRAVRQPARRPLRHVVQPRRRGVHAFGRGGDRGAAAGPGRVSRGPPAVGGVRRRRLARGVRGHARFRSCSRPSRISSRSRRHAARRASCLSPSRSPAGWACSHVSSGRSCSH